METPMKIVLVGDPGVEKFQLLTRFTEDTFNSTFMPSVGVDSKTKTIEINGKKIKLQIWDRAGEEKFRTVIKAYYRDAAGIMLVYDITQEETFHNIPKWLDQVEEYANKDAVKMLIGNHCDMEDKRIINKHRGETFANENGMKFFETSAKANINVEEAFMTMAADILQKHPDLPDTSKGSSSGSK